MAADVRSIDAIREWHAALATYGDTLGEALAGVNLELRRAEDWVAEQLARWQRAIRDCEDDVTRCKAELSQRKFPNWDGREPDCTVQEKNLRVAKARLEHAEDQVVKCRQWLQRLPKMIDEQYGGPGRRLANLVEGALPKALADLARRIGSLDAYAGLRPDYAPAPSAGASTKPEARNPNPESTKPEARNPNEGGGSG
jgi:hypothetical protein